MDLVGNEARQVLPRALQQPDRSSMVGWRRRADLLRHGQLTEHRRSPETLREVDNIASASPVLLKPLLPEGNCLDCAHALQPSKASDIRTTEAINRLIVVAND